MSKKFIAIFFVLSLTACFIFHKSDDLDKIIIKTAVNQITNQVLTIEESGKILNPRTLNDEKIVYISNQDWTSGFFPGTMWYMYDLTENEKWKFYGIKYTENLETMKSFTNHHDIGFIINCSFGNAYRVTQNEHYKSVIIEAANSLATRYRQIPGIIQSWDENRGWQKERAWMCPVIIDNMMNLELLFRATEFSGDSSFYDIAVSHAENTLINHFRKDYSCYHVVDYDKETGDVRGKSTAQGFSDESSWARGQAWALYGFTMCYRETKDIRFLNLAVDIVGFLFSHPNMPNDLIPYWDFNAPKIPEEPRDASAAAIIASALYELSTFSEGNYVNYADKIMSSLASPKYLASNGENGNFLLKHSIGSIPHNNEIDVPLNYADYYFLEALWRKINL